MLKLQEKIETIFKERDKMTPSNVSSDSSKAILETINLLNLGEIRVAEPHKNDWITHGWIKKAILLSFRSQHTRLFHGTYTNYYDKFDNKYHDASAKDFFDEGVRVVPPATVRRGAYLAPGVILMPSYINIGAYIDSGTLIDTWATIGSCAQIGKNVHISGGVGIGGVLEPIQNTPTIIEDNCFIGARSEIVEGVIIEKGSVISMGVYIGKSTKIYNRMNDTVSYGRIPAGSVVVPGSLPSDNGKYNIYCAVIVKNVDVKTLTKTQLNNLVRNPHED